MKKNNPKIISFSLMEGCVSWIKKPIEMIAAPNTKPRPPIYITDFRPKRVNMKEVAKVVSSLSKVMKEDIKSANYPFTAFSTIGLQ